MFGKASAVMQVTSLGKYVTSVVAGLKKTDANVCKSTDDLSCFDLGN